MASSTPGSNGNHKPILTGNTVLDKLLNQLDKGDREFILRLMAELGRLLRSFGESDRSSGILW